MRKVIEEGQAGKVMGWNKDGGDGMEEVDGVRKE